MEKLTSEQLQDLLKAKGLTKVAEIFKGMYFYKFKSDILFSSSVFVSIILFLLARLGLETFA